MRKMSTKCGIHHRGRPKHITTLGSWSISCATLLFGAAAHAGTVTATGNVDALTDVNQMTSVMGVATFDEIAANPFESHSARVLDGPRPHLANRRPYLVSAGLHPVLGNRGATGVRRVRGPFSLTHWGWGGDGPVWSS